MFAEVFGFPKWNNSAGLCWRCNCTPDQITDVGSNASWRRTRTTHWELIAKIRANGAKLSPLLQVPWVTGEIFRVDWLHAANQGVPADIASDPPDPILDRFFSSAARGSRGRWNRTRRRTSGQCFLVFVVLEACSNHRT